MNWETLGEYLEGYMLIFVQKTIEFVDMNKIIIVQNMGDKDATILIQGRRNRFLILPSLIFL